MGQDDVHPANGLTYPHSILYQCGVATEADSMTVTTWCSTRTDLIYKRIHGRTRPNYTIEYSFINLEPHLFLSLLRERLHGLLDPPHSVPAAIRAQYSILYYVLV